MKNPKALITALLSTAVLLSGCSVPTPNLPTDSEKLQVVVTNFAAYDFARGVAGDLADISILLPPGADSHAYEPSPADIIAIDQSDLFIYLGGESDTWVDTVLASTEGVNAVRMMGAQILLLAEDHIHLDDTCTDEDCDHDHDEDDHDHDDTCTDEDCDHDHDEDDHDHDDTCTDEDCDHDHEEVEDEHVHDDACTDETCDHDHEEDTLGAVTSYDEHIWTAPSNAAAVVVYLAEHFAQVDPSNAQTYTANATAYADEITAMGDDFAAFFATVEDNVMVVGDRFPLKYFATEYGIEYYAAFPGCSTETEPSAATMAYLIDLVDDRDLDTVYYIEFSNGLVANAIADATGAQTAMFSACDNYTKEQIDNGVTYVDLMLENLKTLEATMD